MLAQFKYFNFAIEGAGYWDRLIKRRNGRKA